jgi:aspartate/methionine/tyrosine aminotransferase
MTGFRVGWLRASEHIIEIGSKLQEPFISCGVPFAQRGALAALTGPSDPTDFMRAAYRKRRDLALAILAENSMHDYTPDGAFYILVKCGYNSTEFANRLLAEERVAVAPGAAFGEIAKDYVRISFASSDEDVVEGVTRLCRHVRAADRVVV